MIRTGWHAEWDAYMATAPERAHRQAQLARMAERMGPPLRRAAASMSISASQALAALRKMSAELDKLNRPK